MKWRQLHTQKFTLPGLSGKTKRNQHDGMLPASKPPEWNRCCCSSGQEARTAVRWSPLLPSLHLSPPPSWQPPLPRVSGFPGESRCYTITAPLSTSCDITNEEKIIITSPITVFFWVYFILISSLPNTKLPQTNWDANAILAVTQTPNLPVTWYTICTQSN